VARVAEPEPVSRKVVVRQPLRETRATEPASVGGTGLVLIAISPWGSVEVNGRKAGTAPPLHQLTLPEGKHQITVRNQDFPPYRATVRVQAGQPVALKHRFGS
jgi:serine/threonine-protein kinase